MNFIFALLHTGTLLMFQSKIKGKQSGILLYGITPPKSQTSPEKVSEIASRTLSRLTALDIDALVVYDVQDESARTTEERPFPYCSALDPFHYASQYLNTLTIPKIIYRPAGKFSKTELSQWLRELQSNAMFPVFVGIPAPDYVPKTTLRDAYEVWRTQHGHESVIGAVTIPERHALLKDEPARMIDKADCGVSFFISQCIFNVEYAKQMLEDLATSCKEASREIPTIIFTLTICGSVKTLHFMEWLGIHIPESVKECLTSCEDPVKSSAALAVDIAQELIHYCQLHSIPFGFNIESVATRKEEIEASISLVKTVGALMTSHGLRESAAITPAALAAEL